MCCLGQPVGSIMLGTFPHTYDDLDQSKYIRAWQPQCHVHCEEASVDVRNIRDGLPKFSKGRGSKLINGDF